MTKRTLTIIGGAAALAGIALLLVLSGLLPLTTQGP